MGKGRGAGGDRRTMDWTRKGDRHRRIVLNLNHSNPWRDKAIFCRCRRGRQSTDENARVVGRER